MDLSVKENELHTFYWIDRFLLEHKTCAVEDPRPSSTVTGIPVYSTQLCGEASLPNLQIVMETSVLGLNGPDLTCIFQHKGSAVSFAW